jgi:hypothetical protein
MLQWAWTLQASACIDVGAVTQARHANSIGALFG